MKKLFKLCAALVSFVGIGVASGHAAAEEWCGDVKVVEVSAGHNRAPVEYDLAVQVTLPFPWSRNQWTYVRHSAFGHTGVQRIERLTTAAFLSGKTMYWCYDDATENVSRVYLK